MNSGLSLAVSALALQSASGFVSQNSATPHGPQVIPRALAFAQPHLRGAPSATSTTSLSMLPPTQMAAIGKLALDLGIGGFATKKTLDWSKSIDERTQENDGAGARLSRIGAEALAAYVAMNTLSSVSADYQHMVNMGDSFKRFVYEDTVQQVKISQQPVKADEVISSSDSPISGKHLLDSLSVNQTN